MNTRRDWRSSPGHCGNASSGYSCRCTPCTAQGKASASKHTSPLMRRMPRS
ncbi:Uncharacterised protein [Bordetella pertussis]|nr:Uncharacterised protein [Bordetella pertussis]